MTSFFPITGDKISLALDGFRGLDRLNTLITVEQARERGVDIPLLYENRVR